MKIRPFSHDVVSVKFDYRRSPFRCFGPFFPTLEGNVSILIKEDIEKITSIRYGVCGQIDGSYWHVYNDPGAINPLGNNEMDDIQTDSHVVFDIGKDLPIKCGADGASFAKDQALSADFLFTLPWDQIYLPSTTSAGIHVAGQGNITVSYKLYVRVTHPTSLGNAKTSEYTEFFPYQADSMYLIDNPSQREDFSASDVFKGKLTAKVVGSDGKLVASPMLNAYTHTRKLRSLFDKKYSKSQYGKHVKDIPITVAFETPIGFNLLQSFSSQVVLKFQVHLPNGLEPEYSYKGESTGLGVFELLQLKVLNYYRMNLSVQSFPFMREGSFVLSEIAFKNGQRLFDIADFIYDKEHDVYELRVPLTDIDSSRGHTFLEGLNQPVVMNGQCDPYFSANSSLGFVVKLGNNSKEDHHTMPLYIYTKANFMVGEPAAPPEY